MTRQAAALAILFCLPGCSDVNRNRDTVKPTYDRATGRLIELTSDGNADGRIDTWTDMDGARPLRSRLDRNQDGRIDRWEDYDRSGRLVRVGYSRSDNGRPDSWAYATPDGRLERVEISRSGDERRIDRREFYDPGAPIPEASLLRTEEDTNGDGRMDTWETYAAGALKTAAWDENGDGIVDRRLTYRGSAPVVVESEPDPSGRFKRLIEVK